MRGTTPNREQGMADPVLASEVLPFVYTISMIGWLMPRGSLATNFFMGE